MYDTCTIFCGHVVARNDTESTFAGVNPREEGFVLKTDEVGAFVASDDLGLQSFAFFVCPAEVFLIGI